MYKTIRDVNEARGFVMFRDRTVRKLLQPPLMKVDYKQTLQSMLA